MCSDLARHPTTYGWRGKIGVIVPPTNTVNEAEWQLMAPDGVTIHATRMKLHEDTTSEFGKRALYRDIRAAAADLAQARMDVIAYGCTAGSMVQPMTELSDFMASVSGTPSVTTAASIVNAFAALGISRIAVATPYHDTLNHHEKEFLEGAGLDVVHIAGLGFGANGPHEYIEIARTHPSEIFEHIIACDRPEAEGLLVSCTDFPVMEMLAHLEEQIGKPVVTSNQSTFWAALRAAGLGDKLQNYGMLLSDY